MACAQESGSLEVPVHLRNALTKLMKSMGYGADYRYSHNESEAFSAGQSYLPPELDGRQFYEPQPRGLEIELKEKSDYLKTLDEQVK